MIPCHSVVIVADLYLFEHTSIIHYVMHLIRAIAVNGIGCKLYNILPRSKPVEMKDKYNLIFTFNSSYTGFGRCKPHYCPIAR